ncbi:Uncharacterised protein [Mycobacteroides abscessus]|nr:Uncharacterised protein [Mycobacteroides abscessus]
MIFSTTSLSDSMCWMLTVEMTSIPASSSRSTSCQRFSWSRPGAFVCASSSTSATSGRRARTASRSRSVSSTPRWVTRTRGTTSRPSAMAAVAARPWVSTTATTTSLPSSRRRRPSSSMA